MRNLLAYTAALTLLAASLVAQDLAAAAEKERERRRKVGQKAQVYTNDDITKEKPGATPKPSPPPDGRSAASVPRRLLGLGATEGTEEPSPPSAPQEGGCEGAACGDDSTAASGGDQRSEAFWRQRADALRKAVEDAEAKVKHIEQQLAGVRQGQSQPLPSDGIRQLPPNPLLAPPEHAALAQQLETAKAELVRAQQALLGLDEEVRKAGVPPGWIR
jgi:hypothetical protein